MFLRQNFVENESLDKKNYGKEKKYSDSEKKST
jgi:hypothetical protein